MSRKQFNNDCLRPEFGATPWGYYTPRGQYIRKRPKQLHSRPVEYWYPAQDVLPGLVDFGNELNNPIPILNHDQAVRSTGRIYRIPLKPRYQEENMVSDGMVMFVSPDPTLMGYQGNSTGATAFPPLIGTFAPVGFTGVQNVWNS